MPYRKVMAFFMHEEEQYNIQTKIQPVCETESYFIGDMDDSDIEELTNKGYIIEEVKPVATQDFDSTLLKGLSIPSFQAAANANADGDDDVINFNDNSGFPGFYLFQMDEPMVEPYREALQQEGIDIREYIPFNTYLVKIDSFQQYGNLGAMPFVKNLRFYGVASTPVVISPLSAATQPQDSEKKIITYDILLLEEPAKAEIIQWLADNHVAVAGSDGLKIRIYLLEDSPLLEDIQSLPTVRAVEEYVKPQLHNDRAWELLNITKLSNDGVTYLTGKDEIVGVADTGIDDTHPDFAGQLLNTPVAWGRRGDYSDTHGHGTHVAGSVAGSGASSNGEIKGMAPAAKIFFQSIMGGNGDLNLPLQLSKLFDEAYKKGARIHNNSWGSSTNSRYTVNSVEVDDFVWRNKDMLLVFSAGNDGLALQPPGNVDLSYPDLLTIGSPASAKNVLTVGASRSDRTDGGYSKFTYGKIWSKSFPVDPFAQETVSGDPQSLAGFSSRGPCDDTRIKPDIVAPGTDIASVKSAAAPLSNFWGIHPNYPDYAFLGGTSMAAPIVSGCAALVREYYRTLRNHQPSAALLKATLINGTVSMQGIDANMKCSYYNQGFGLVNMLTTIPSPTNNFALKFLDAYNQPARQFVRTGQKVKLLVTFTQPAWLKITLCYTDYPGNGLQNNLNLLMDSLATRQKKWGNEAVPTLLKKLDSTNNVETITIAMADAGNYSVQIIATNLIKTPQDYALVITSGDPAFTLTY